MSIVSRGFHGRREPEAADLPPGQYLTRDFPVLQAGPTPRVDLDTWQFTISNEAGAKYTWSWRELLALPSEKTTTDIHCVTKWSKLNTTWQGVSLDTLFEDVETAATTRWSGATADTPRTCRSRTCSTTRRGSPTATRART